MIFTNYSAIGDRFREASFEMRQHCPQCGLLNPLAALRCECGWDFRTLRERWSTVAGYENASATLGVRGRSGNRLG